MSMDEEMLSIAHNSTKSMKPASPMIWIPLSLLVAVIFAISNVTLSLISHYEFKARYLQSPGNFVGNLIPLILVTVNERFGKNSAAEPNECMIEENQPKRRTYFTWLFELYFAETTNLEGVKKTHAIRSRFIVTFLVIGLTTLQFWMFFKSYNSASNAGLNNGVIMSLFSLKPIYTSILFYIFFNQKLQRFEYIGIALCVVSALVIGCSTLESEETEEASNNRWHTFMSLAYLNTAIIAICVRTAMLKYYFAFKQNQGNVSAFFNFSLLILDGLFLSLFLIDISNGFTFTGFEFLCSTVGGLLSSMAGYLIAYVNIRGKAGTSDALIETSVIYQVILDAIFFGRQPNDLQILSLVIGIGATLVILYGHYKG